MWSLATVSSFAATYQQAASDPSPTMDVFMVTGFLGSLLTLLLWLYQAQSRRCAAGLAVCLAGMAI
ncbi:MAG TPA: hypothetical protein VGG44_04870, partial [Tepidisphaeraceae bacterium]